MKVGILSSCMHSMFSGGVANTTIALLETFKLLGHDAIFVNTYEKDWFEDCKLLEKQIKVLNISKDEDIEEVFDLIHILRLKNKDENILRKMLFFIVKTS